MKNRRTFIQQSAAAASTLAFPLIGGAQPAAVKIGVLHPVTGALAFSGQQCREGALLAERSEFIESGMQAYEKGLKRQLLWLIYILPTIGFAATIESAGGAVGIPPF